MTVNKIISGGQSGVDRAALDFAIKNKLPCGGWCPKGRLAEDGKISNAYPLKETKTTIYAERTSLNVDDSTATLIIYDQLLGNGSAYTADYAASVKKPFFIANINKAETIDNIRQWLKDNQVEVLNIAGPRESTSPGIYSKTLVFLQKLFEAK